MPKRWIDFSQILVKFSARHKIKNIALQKKPIFLLNGEVIWQASDSPLSKELHGETFRVIIRYIKNTFWFKLSQIFGSFMFAI